MGGRERERNTYMCVHARTYTCMHAGTEHLLCARPQGCSSLSRGSSRVSPEVHRTCWALSALNCTFSTYSREK